MVLHILSLNANGIRSAQRKSFFEWFDQQNVDIACLQETRISQDQLNASFYPKGYHTSYISAEKKGYSGVAIYSKEKPMQITSHVDCNIMNKEGRFLRYDFEKISICSIYLPSGSSSENAQQKKYEVLDWFKDYMQKNPNVMYCGDFNIAHDVRDIKNWKGNKKNSGFLPEERAWMDHICFELGFVDAFRTIPQPEHTYSWWSNRGQAYNNNVGWRIDYHLLPQYMKNKIIDYSIYTSERFSDHAPCSLWLNQ